MKERNLSKRDQKHNKTKDRSITVSNHKGGNVKNKTWRIKMRKSSLKKIAKVQHKELNA